MKVGILPRWAIGYLILFLLLAGSNAYAVLKLYRLSMTTIPSLDVDIRLLDLQRQLLDATFGQLRYAQRYLLTGDAYLYDQFTEARNEFHRFLGESKAIADSGPKADSLGRIERYQQRYEAIVDEEVAALTAEGRYERTRREAEKDRVTDGLLEELKLLEGYARRDASLKMGIAREAASSALRFACLSSLAAVACALFISFAMTRSITRPLARLVNRTREISSGAFDGHLAIASPPEIAELAGAFNAMCEKLNAVDRMKTDFLSMISHELRTPLTTIREGASLLLEGIGGDITEKQHKLLGILFTETNRLIDMVNSILDLSKMEAGMMTYTFEEADIGPLVEQALTEMTPLMEAKKIAFARELDAELVPVRMDTARVLQILRNLIGNAAKFTPEHGRIVVRARKAGGGIEVSVRDTGPGIPMEKLPTIFEKFSGTDHKGGTGLGLAIVKHIVAVHGGRVWAESVLEQGSRFVFVLPS